MLFLENVECGLGIGDCFSCLDLEGFVVQLVVEKGFTLEYALVWRSYAFLMVETVYTLTFFQGHGSGERRID